jgi:biopolymer transport protein ExbD
MFEAVVGVGLVVLVFGAIFLFSRSGNKNPGPNPLAADKAPSAVKLHQTSVEGAMKSFGGKKVDPPKPKLVEANLNTVNNVKTNYVTMAEGRLFLNNRTITLEDLERALGHLTAGAPDMVVCLRADERFESTRVVDVMRILYKVNIRHLELETLKE